MVQCIRVSWDLKMKIHITTTHNNYMIHVRNNRSYCYRFPFHIQISIGQFKSDIRRIDR